MSSATEPTDSARATYRGLIDAVRTGDAFQPQAAGLMFGVGTATSLLGQFFNAGGRAALLNEVGVALAANVLTAGMALLTWWFWLRRSARHNLIIIGCFAAMLGVLQTMSRLLFLNLAGLSGYMTVQQRIGAGIVHGLFWLITASAYFDHRNRFLRDRAELLEAKVSLELRELRQSLITDVLTRELIDSVGARLAASVSDTRALLTNALTLDDSTAALQRIAVSLRENIDHEIRPLSRELWVDDAMKQVRSRIPWLMLLRVGCYSAPFPVALFLALAAFGMSPTLLSMGDLGQAALTFALQLVVVGSLLIFADEFIRTHDRRSPWNFWIWVCVTPISTVLPITLLHGFGWPTSRVLYWMVFTGFGIPALVVVAAIIAGAGGTRTSVLQRVRESIDYAEVAAAAGREQMREASRRLARQLHSSLQGRLMAMSLELQHAAEHADPEQAAAALRRLEQLLAVSLVDAFEESDVDLVAALEQLTSEWSAIVQLTTRIEVNGELPNRVREVVIGIVEEAIANAVRHAGALTVTAYVREEQSDIIVEVWNDGRPLAQPAPGLGSRWLDAVSGAHWTLGAEAEGVMLRVRIPRD